MLLSLTLNLDHVRQHDVDMISSPVRASNEKNTSVLQAVGRQLCILLEDDVNRAAGVWDDLPSEQTGALTLGPVCLSPQRVEALRSSGESTGRQESLRQDAPPETAAARRLKSTSATLFLELCAFNQKFTSDTSEDFLSFFFLWVFFVLFSFFFRAGLWG